MYWWCCYQYLPIYFLQSSSSERKEKDGQKILVNIATGSVHMSGSVVEWMPRICLYTNIRMYFFNSNPILCLQFPYLGWFLIKEFDKKTAFFAQPCKCVCGGGGATKKISLQCFFGVILLIFFSISVSKELETPPPQ